LSRGGFTVPTDKTLKTFLRIEQKLSDAERKIKNPFIFCVPVDGKAAADALRKESGVTQLTASKNVQAFFLSEESKEKLP
ncbi:MAG: hypothetical protein PHU80_08810, partial [Kiritimatiellae bacterium]|nr:hypothetical protein [Kiritimatiellia bacterium]